MRRTEFDVKDTKLLEELLATCDYGTLSLVDGDIPYGVPLNFVWYEKSICFHGSKEGRKMELISKNSKASLSIVKPLSIIPSYFSNTRSACPATQLFMSVHMVGTIKTVEDEKQKCSMLTALMQKLQPENGYDPIDATSPMYKKMIEQTALFCLMPESISLKLKAGQNLTEERKALLIEKLMQRGEEIDLLSVKMIHQATIR